MPRPQRKCVENVAYHVMNRSVEGRLLYEKPADYFAFEQVMIQARERFPAVRIAAYCLMPNHFHLVLWPRQDDALSSFMQWLSMTHTQRWRAHRSNAGRGHLYQSRFKSFPIEQDHHFLSVCRYVERNPLRAGLTWPPNTPDMRAEFWPWNSIAARLDPDRREQLCDPWPVEIPQNWLEVVNRPEAYEELEAIRKCAARGRPYGNETWTLSTAADLGILSTIRATGRPRKKGSEALFSET